MTAFCLVWCHVSGDSKLSLSHWLCSGVLISNVFLVGKLQRKILRKRRKVKKTKRAVNYRLFQKAEFRLVSWGWHLCLCWNRRMKMAAMVKGEKHFLYSLQREGEGLHDRKSLLKCQERIPGCFLQKLEHVLVQWMLCISENSSKLASNCVTFTQFCSAPWKYCLCSDHP